MSAKELGPGSDVPEVAERPWCRGHYDAETGRVLFMALCLFCLHLRGTSREEQG